MSGISFTQLRTAANPGLEGSGATDLIQVKVTTGISLGASGVGVDTASTVAFSGADWTFGAGELKVTGSSFSSTQVPNADWVTSQIATGVNWKFPVYGSSQLSNGNDCVLQAIPFYLDGQPTATNTFIITDGSTTETYTFVATETAAFDVAIGVDADTTMTNLAQAINDDSALWVAALATTLDSINDGSGTSTAGYVVVVARADQAAASYADRIYGTLSTPAFGQYVNLSGEDGYTKTTSSQLPATDPAAKQFGPGTQTTDLLPGEAHVTLADNSQYVWDADGLAWVQISGTGSVTAGTGLTKSGNTINVGSGSTGNIGGIAFSADNIAVAPGDGIQLASNLVALDLEAAGAGTGGLTGTGSTPNKKLAVLAGAGIELTALGVAVDIETAGGGTGGLALVGTGAAAELAVLAGAGIELTATGVAVDLEAAGAGTGGLRLVGTGAAAELGVDPGNGIALSANGVDIDTASTVTFSGASWTFGNGELDVTGSSFSSTQVPNADWVLSQVATGVAWKFPILAAVSELGADAQLYATGGGTTAAVRQAIIFFPTSNPVATDTFIITDGSTTETFTFVATETAAFDIEIGGNPGLTMVNMAVAINADSSLWNATVLTGLDALNANVLMVYRTSQAADSYADRIYGVWGTQANAKYVNYNGEDTYSKTTSSTLPASDPAQKEFGPGTANGSLTAGEAHVELNDDMQWVYDADGDEWVQISGTGSITAGAGLTKSGNTINFSDNGAGTFDGLVIGADSVAVAVADGVRIASHFVTLLLEAAGDGTGGLVLNGTSPLKELAIDIDATSTGAIASVMDLNANGLAINVDNSTIEGSAAGGVLRVKDAGIVAAKLGTDAATIAKINLKFYEDTYTGATFTTGGAGAYHDLSVRPLTDAKVDFYNATYRNGVLDMTNVGAAGTPASATQYRIYDTGTVGRVEIGADITGDGHTYKMRYVAANS